MENGQRWLERRLRTLAELDAVPRLLLHSCCAPCSSYVLEYLSEYFEITVFYYNPNITEAAEYRRRADEQRRLIAQMPLPRAVRFLEGPYCPEAFLELAKGLEGLPEGGERCRRCYRMRLQQTAETAAAGGFDCFATTLSISPYKDAQTLNELGAEIGRAAGVEYLYADFKKRDGYRRSCELSKQYGLYRQNYCGCRFSRPQRDASAGMTAQAPGP